MKNSIFNFSQVTNDETPEEIFSKYDKERKLSDYQKLYNLGIFLHVNKDNNLKRADFFDLKPNHRLVKAYDKVNGTIIFTKIWVY